MNKNPFRMICIWILSGAAAGSLIGILGVSGIIPEAYLKIIVPSVLKICIGIIAAIVDVLCLFALFKPLLDSYIDKNGVLSAGTIVDVREIPRPDQLCAGDWERLSRFACTVSYKAGTKEYRKEYPPTALTSRQKLYPLSLAEGEQITIKYLKAMPFLSVLDAEILKTQRKSEITESRIYFIIIPLIVTIACIAALSKI